MFCHDGGFVSTSALEWKAYDVVCRQFVRKILAMVASVNYWLAPERTPVPNQYDDGFDVLRFLDEGNGGKVLPMDANVACYFLASDSSRGNLARNVASENKIGGSEGRHWPAIVVVVGCNGDCGSWSGHTSDSDDDDDVERWV
ncbi:hypothetical protein RJ639_019189 [Escallonia herrerae]|uniref:Alpha/beta hydrolase fold-3 domain-containing protein n=1 Tax=Escallonia herrerae TaxID=1293975 RepID=A0AA88V6I6_9ASTE|nr:hypothetical protein RJ639_019189 [Escallonia herrerae]